MSDNFSPTTRYSACGDVKMMYTPPKLDPPKSDNFSPTTIYSACGDAKMMYASAKYDSSSGTEI